MKTQIDQLRDLLIDYKKINETKLVLQKRTKQGN